MPPQKKGMTGRKALKCGAALLLVGAVLAGAVLWHYWSPYRTWARYASLELAMTPEEVEAHFGRSFEQAIAFRECTIRWMATDIFEYSLNLLDRFSGNYPGNEDRVEIDSVGQIPTVYAYLECLFDAEGKLVAYTISGEEVKIHTIIGDLQGQMLCELSEEQWKHIVAGEDRKHGAHATEGK